MRLFGFVDEAERELFRSLLKVNGVGPAHALALLSASAPDELWARDPRRQRDAPDGEQGNRTEDRAAPHHRAEGRSRAAGAEARPRAAGGPLPPRDRSRTTPAAPRRARLLRKGAALKAVQAAKKRLDKPSRSRSSSARRSRRGAPIAGAPGPDSPRAGFGRKLDRRGRRRVAALCDVRLP